MTRSLAAVDSQSLERFNPLVRFAIRLSWAAVIGIALTTAFFSMPVTFAMQMSNAITLFSEPLSALGWSPVVFALWIVVAQIIYILIALIVAFLLLWQRPHDWLAMITGAVLVLFGTLNLNTGILFVRDYPPAIAVITINGVLFAFCANWLLLIFPDGRFFPRWTALFLIPIPALILADTALRLNLDDTTVIATPYTMALTLWTLLGLGTQLFRYRYYLTQLQKQQVKWVVGGMSLVTLSILLLFIIDPLLTPWLIERPMLRMFYRMAYPVLLIFLPVTISALALVNAVLKRNLWGVDFTINRSLGYGVVGTAVLLVLLGVVSGGDFFRNPLVFGLLVVALAAAFNPLRRLIQAQIDRRLYDLRYSVETYTRAPRPIVTQPGRLTGAHIDRWELLDFIGRGATSEVYKGFCAGQIAAVKVMPSSADAEVRMRFDREVDILESLNHPRIVRFIQHGEVDDQRYMVLQYVEGETLRGMLVSRGKLPLAAAQAVTRDMAAALDYVHQRGIIHRDLKPSNIMLTTPAAADGSFRAMLMDFGIAKAESVQVTGGGTMGTIDYMAPEQIQSSGAVSPASDVYALGVIVFEMLTGLRPFRGNPGQVLFAHLRQPAPDVRQFEPDLPPQVALALMRALSKSPEDRYLSAGEFYRALRQKVADETADIRLY
ncbi:MAG: serine/threonine protein kinase [Anaerolineae bacterium]|nr:serine/threonine protein kinase [Anaerolineae bacterium]